MYRLLLALLAFTALARSTYDDSILQLRDDDSGSSSDATCSQPGTVPPPRGNSGQQIALASYISPAAYPDAWNRIIGYNSTSLSVLVANVNNGPDYIVDSNWKSVIDRSSASGKTILGYVRTGYLGLSQQQFTTRLGSRNLADWTAQIERDVDKWYELYGSSIGGIFFDEGWNQCGANNVYSGLYSYINQYTKTKHPGAYTVLNPGGTLPQCFESTMDTLMTFENSYTAYQNGNYVPNNWTPADPRKIWHIIYNVPDSAVSQTVALAQSRGAGMVEVTNGNLPNPYGVLPADSYMQAQLNAVAGGSPPVTDPLPPQCGSTVSTPTNFNIIASDYTTISLNWTSDPNSLGTNIYLNGSSLISLPAGLSQVTIPFFTPGQPNLSITLTSLGGSGQESDPTDPIVTSTLPLPNNQPVINLTASVSSSSTLYTANVLIPYTTLRLFIWYDGTNSSHNGWPINFNTGNYVFAPYLVDAGTVYSYAGDKASGYPYSWNAIGSVSVSQSGYAVSWTVPVGSSSFDTSKWIVQTQGYGPAVNAFAPCPVGADGSGPDGNGRYC